MRIYLASRWSRRNELRTYAGALRSLGHQVTARWLYEHERTDDPKLLKEYALHDMADITHSDTFVYFAPAGQHGGSRVELGFALALRKRVFLIGEPDGQFSYLDEVMSFADWNSFCDAIRRYKEGR